MLEKDKDRGMRPLTDAIHKAEEQTATSRKMPTYRLVRHVTLGLLLVVAALGTGTGGGRHQQIRQQTRKEIGETLRDLRAEKCRRTHEQKNARATE